MRTWDPGWPGRPHGQDRNPDWPGRPHGQDQDPDWPGWPRGRDRAWGGSVSLLLDAIGELCCPAAAGSHRPLRTEGGRVHTEEGGQAEREALVSSACHPARPRVRDCSPRTSGDSCGWLQRLFQAPPPPPLQRLQNRRAACAAPRDPALAGAAEGAGLRPIGQWPARGGCPCSGAAAPTLASSDQRAGPPSCAGDQAAPPSARKHAVPDVRGGHVMAMRAVTLARCR